MISTGSGAFMPGPRGWAGSRSTPLRTTAEGRDPFARGTASAGQRELSADIQTFDNRRQFIVRPDEIRSGDWLRDLGTLRQVRSVEKPSSATRSHRLFVLRFVSAPGVEDLTLGIPSTVTITIWRPT